MANERLDKALAGLGYGSRKQVGSMIKAGRVTINGMTIRNAAQHIDTEKDKISIDGRDIVFKSASYYMLNKPQGLVSACKDNLHETVLSVFPENERKNLFPVGRLDKNTEGLLIITDDGDFCHMIMSPKRHVSKVYEADVLGQLDENAVSMFENGLELADGTVCKKAELIILQKEQDITKIRVTLHEGKHHQVKRMVAAAGGHVEYLKRISIGSVLLDESLKLGEYRPLTDDEVQRLKNDALAKSTK